MSVVKCFVCGKTFDKDRVKCVIHSSRRYSHYVCEPDKPLFVPNLSPEELEKIELQNYIIELYGLETCGPRINKEIKEYHDKYGYSYSGILKSLKWWYEVKGNKVTDQFKGTIAIVGSIYNQAYEYYHYLYLAKIANSTESIENFKIEQEEITIASPRAKKKSPRLFKFDEPEDTTDE